MTNKQQNEFEKFYKNFHPRLIEIENYSLAVAHESYKAGWAAAIEFAANVCVEAEIKSAPGYNYEDGYADAMHDAKLLIRKKGSE